jgi:hypothetical protein
MNIDKPAPSLTAFAQARRPYPQFVSTTYWFNDGQSKYDSIQFEATRRYGFFQFNGHYTLSNAMSNYLNLENPYSHNLWNRDQFNARNRAVISGHRDLPFGKGRRYISNAPKLAEVVLSGPASPGLILPMPIQSADCRTASPTGTSLGAISP